MPARNLPALPIAPRSRLGPLGEKYVLEKELSSSRTSTIYDAAHLVADRQVAVEVLSGLWVESAAQRERFDDAARAVAELFHENLAVIFDFGVTDDGAPYFVSDLPEGETLDRILANRGVLAPAYASAIVTKVLAALEAAHAIGIVHGDVRPENVVVANPNSLVPRVKLLGFATSASTRVLARKEKILAEPARLSPEQALGGAPDFRSDIYATGVLLYEMLGGEPPFSEAMPQLLTDVLGGKHQPLSAVNPAVPRALNATVEAAMQTVPENRIRSARDFAAQLRRYASSSISDPRTGSAVLHRGVPSELQSHTDPPEHGQQSRDFPSRDLAKVAGKPRGELLADSLLQSPIIPKAPAPPKIQLFGSTRDVESWFMPELEGPIGDAAPPPSETLESMMFSGDRPRTRSAWNRAAWVAMLGAGAGAVLAWLCRAG